MKGIEIEARYLKVGDKFEDCGDLHEVKRIDANGDILSDSTYFNPTSRNILLLQRDGREIVTDDGECRHCDALINKLPPDEIFLYPRPENELEYSTYCSKCHMIALGDDISLIPPQQDKPRTARIGDLPVESVVTHINWVEKPGRIRENEDPDLKNLVLYTANGGKYHSGPDVEVTVISTPGDEDKPLTREKRNKQWYEAQKKDLTWESSEPDPDKYGPEWFADIMSGQEIKPEHRAEEVRPEKTETEIVEESVVESGEILLYIRPQDILLLLREKISDLKHCYADGDIYQIPIQCTNFGDHPLGKIKIIRDEDGELRVKND